MDSMSKLTVDNLTVDGLFVGSSTTPSYHQVGEFHSENNEYGTTDGGVTLTKVAGYHDNFKPTSLFNQDADPDVIP
jgi:hypothetical protein